MKLNWWKDEKARLQRIIRLDPMLLAARDNASRAILPKPAMVRGVRVSDPTPWTGPIPRASKDEQTAQDTRLRPY
jgi:hypothetical protein